MNPGKLGTRCAFQKATKVSDGGGGYTTTWPTQFSRWGALAFPRMTAQQEAIAAGSVESVTRATLTVRDDSQTATITNDWRVTAEGRTWNVREVPPGVDGYIRVVIESGVPT